MFNNNTTATSSQCAGEKILKIGQYLTKIWTITKWDVFLRHSVVSGYVKLFHKFEEGHPKRGR